MFPCDKCLVNVMCKTPCDELSKLIVDDFEDSKVVKKILSLKFDSNRNYTFRKGLIKVNVYIRNYKTGIHWFKEGFCHRENGPAIKWSDGSEYHWLYDIFLWSYNHEGYKNLRINRNIN